jgi:drug/metabolite transporter (DMT)-like permease
MLDMTGTGVMNAGLCLTYASVFQMLRSAVVVFTAFMSVAILKRKLRAFHWASIALVVAGVSVVGYVSIKYSGDDSTKSQSSVMLGNALVIVAQAMVALQMVVEEKVRAGCSASF